MLVEIPIIQKMVLYFGNPSLTFSIILFSILLSSGLGSLISGNKYVKRFTDNSYYYLLFTAITILIIGFSLNKIIEITNDYVMMQKMVIGFLIILPMGILMGIPFPTGISKLKNIYKEEDILPLMWGANGIFSVIGSLLAVALSIKFGFNSTIYIGAMIYLFLLFYIGVFL
ncbi:spermidine synthase family protein [Tepidibacter formicigenes]|jgi:hypothetical protein|uniref:Spermine/spermidine synthase n=1 Tax=Tepidibacter formicigenes DSM 15518 TaxID=1123349 RepID=A0A1M6LK62_9FIRM|nr:hypothetical protein [Tepidibacter formicigenes]SHJ71560.1 hypothetical protein SAMN02744037_00664 [Tepidibacter formicigenes DSM 15518]